MFLRVATLIVAAFFNTEEMYMTIPELERKEFKRKLKRGDMFMSNYGAIFMLYSEDSPIKNHMLVYVVESRRWNYGITRGKLVSLNRYVDVYRTLRDDDQKDLYMKEYELLHEKDACISWKQRVKNFYSRNEIVNA